MHPSTNEYASRLPRKLAEYIASKNKEHTLLVTYNCSGIPPNDENLLFEDHTLMHRIADARNVIGYMQKSIKPYAAKSIVICGISTGAIIASALRAEYVRQDFHETMEFVAIAGLLDVKGNRHFDFTPEQINDFDKYGYC